MSQSSSSSAMAAMSSLQTFLEDGNHNSKTTTTTKKKPNLLLIITDQERALQHWPDDFSRQHLPARERLLKNGLSFERFYCNACMCSPSRATLLTSQFPAVTGVMKTGSPQPSVSLPTPEEGLENLATLLSKQGYHCEWHGKWHLGGEPSDYGFHGWQPPDAGNYLSLNETLGGGTPNNDARFLQEATQFLQNPPPDDKPFCLVVSFVNPHDVYVAQCDVPTWGYTPEDFEKVKVPLPTNYKEDFRKNRKPRAHDSFYWERVHFENQPQDYVNFYAHLHTVVDAQIGMLLDALDSASLTSSTLIVRTADHGEQALSHGLVEKFFNVYEESIRIPLIVSNPIVFPHPQSTSALASHLDLVPTIMELVELAAVDEKKEEKDQLGALLVPDADSPTTPTRLGGASLIPVLQQASTSVQTALHFTYDDIPSRSGPATVRCITTERYKYAVYYHPKGIDADWELYDLQQDPLEDANVAGTAEHQEIQAQLDAQLVDLMTQHQTLPKNFPWPPKATKYSVGVPDDTIVTSSSEEID